MASSSRSVKSAQEKELDAKVPIPADELQKRNQLVIVTTFSPMQEIAAELERRGVEVATVSTPSDEECGAIVLKNGVTIVANMRDAGELSAFVSVEDETEWLAFEPEEGHFYNGRYTRSLDALITRIK